MQKPPPATCHWVWNQSRAHALPVLRTARHEKVDPSQTEHKASQKSWLCNSSTSQRGKWEQRGKAFPGPGAVLVSCRRGLPTLTPILPPPTTTCWAVWDVRGRGRKFNPKGASPSRHTLGGQEYGALNCYMECSLEFQTNYEYQVWQNYQ